MFVFHRALAYIVVHASRPPANTPLQMKVVRHILSKVATEHGVYIFIAVVSVIGSLVGLFFDINGTVSVKWIIGTICLSLMIISILFRSLVAMGERNLPSESIRVIKHFPEKNVLLIRTNFDLSVNSLLSIFVTNDGYEELYAYGYVENVQEKHVASLRIIREFMSLPKTLHLTEAAMIKTTLPHRIFEDIQQ